jgi:uncharacterized protein YkwD
MVLAAFGTAVEESKQVGGLPMGDRVLPVALVLLVVLPLLGQQASLPDKQRDAVREQVFTLINKLRHDQGLRALKRQSELDKLAQDHATNLGRQDKLGDDGKNPHVLDGKNPDARLKASPYIAKRFSENIAFCRGIPANKVASVAARGWKSSPPHWKTICNGDFTETGVGVARGKSGRWYFVQVFGTPKAR